MTKTWFVVQHKEPAAGDEQWADFNDLIHSDRRQAATALAYSQACYRQLRFRLICRTITEEALP